MTHTEDLQEAVTSQIDHTNNPLNFHFADDIADRQRKQYESDIGRKRNSNKYTINIPKISTSLFLS